MDDMLDETEEVPRLRGRARHRILRSTAAVPSLVTLGNGIAGFAAIHFATKLLPPAVIAAGADKAGDWVARNLEIAAWLVLVGMVCDVLDGQLARLTRRTSDFGAQLDSLCDAITFGVAPAILVLRTVQSVLFPIVGEVDVLPKAFLAGRAVWFIAALYASCTIMRLARFNVENKPDLAYHMAFKGLPSPAAALSVVSLVLLHAHLRHVSEGWRSLPEVALVVVWSLPAVTLATALLMVSRLRFAHVVNQYIRGRKSFGYIVRLVILALAAIALDLRIALAAASILYVLSGPAGWVWRRARRKPAEGIAGPAPRQNHAE